MMYKLGEVFDNFNVFQKIYNRHIIGMSEPILEETEASLLDSYYFNGWSYDKYITPMLEKHIEGGVIPEVYIDILADFIWGRFGRNWEQYKKYIKADYDVFDDVEEETRIIKGDETQKPENWASVTQGLSSDNNSETEEYTYGFNSNTATPSGKSTIKTSNKQTTSQEGSYKTSEDRTETINRKGSSKLRTGSEMIEFDYRFWGSWDFYESMFKDVDKVLTLLVY